MIAASSQAELAPAATSAEAASDEHARRHRRPRFPGRGLLSVTRSSLIWPRPDSTTVHRHTVDYWSRDPVIRDSLADIETAVNSASDAFMREAAAGVHPINTARWQPFYRTSGDFFLPHGPGGPSFDPPPPPPRRRRGLADPGESWSVYAIRSNWIRNSWDERVTLLIPEKAKGFYEQLEEDRKAERMTRRCVQLVSIRAQFQTPWQRDRARRALVLATKQSQRWLVKHRDARVKKVAAFVPVLDIAKIVCGYLAPAAHVQAAALPSV